MSECNSTPWINGIVLISTGITFLLSGLTIASQTKKQKKEERADRQARPSRPKSKPRPRYLRYPETLDL